MMRRVAISARSVRSAMAARAADRGRGFQPPQGAKRTGKRSSLKMASAGRPQSEFASEASVFERLGAPPRLRLVFATLLTLALVFSLFVCTHSAHAGEGEGENIVDPAQRADNSFIYDTTVSSLYSQASLYDQHTVQVTGEVIGDRIRATDNACWITLTETIATDSSTISVLMSNELAAQIDHYGRYGVKGTTLQVRGTYHQACDEHDGLPDIHVTNCSVLARGEDVPDQLDLSDLAVAFVMLGLGAALMGSFYFVREKTR